MAVLLLALLMLFMPRHASSTWCVCKEMSDTALQKTLDYACGAGADCAPIHSNGPCFQPNTVRAHCNYAVNSFFQRKAQAPGSCDFAGTASISTSDPSINGCSYPATVSAAGTSTTTTTPTPTSATTNPSTTTTPSSTTTPYSTTPSNSVVGGFGNGVSPTGAGINTDITDGGCRVPITSLFSVMTTTLLASSLLL